jgi:hypothetical protein
VRPLIPWHWSIAGPTRPRPAARLLRVLNVRAGHVATFRRLLRIGPYGVIVLRYRPGHVDEPDRKDPTP